ncbi:MAG: RNA polymerase sigma factor [Alphaproteobacteria bacterium ADurb.BinA280]|jgi:RNA polymerase sigma factor (TIGR02999 family)|nr:MAG: RNA polymerase sigma factor [Alphaproteobacteria bacterium ADurb.BinA280]
MIHSEEFRDEITQPLPAMEVAGSELTQLLQAWRGGDRSALDRLLPEVYSLLRRMASSRIGVNDRTPTLEPTALVHEALLRLMGQGADWQNRSHFLAIAALQMRAVLVDHARSRMAAKRGGGAAVLTLGALDAESNARNEIDLLALDQAMDQLRAQDERTARVIEMNYFAGMQREEIAEVLAVSVATVDRDLRFARAFLNRQLNG